jgi:membrane protein insertase Oxa1/YidC/SpoIIIJ
MKAYISPKEMQLEMRAIEEKRRNHEWAITNDQELQKKYGGQVIAIYKEEIIYSAENLSSLLKQIPEGDPKLEEIAIEYIFKKAA